MHNNKHVRMVEQSARGRAGGLGPLIGEGSTYCCHRPKFVKKCFPRPEQSCWAVVFVPITQSKVIAAASALPYLLHELPQSRVQSTVPPLKAWPFW